MKFGPVSPADALGGVTVHTLRQGDLVLKKGTAIGTEEVAALTRAGVKEVVVVRLEEGDVSEDSAAASIAQATCSAAFSRIAADSIQTLGGIGFTWEHQAHLYFKRSIVDAALLGSAEEHRSRVAELVLDTASAEKPPRVADGTRG
jgi:alkylation response protein AidB-like acyl-CoA dehydrogenase